VLHLGGSATDEVYGQDEDDESRSVGHGTLGWVTWGRSIRRSGEKTYYRVADGCGHYENGHRVLASSLFDALGIWDIQ
jgi:hypothetical protein